MPDFSTIIRWLVIWILFVTLICGAGALVGGILFPIVGLILGMKLSVVEMIKNGLFDGVFLAGIWAPAVSLVVCLMKSREAKRNIR